MKIQFSLNTQPVTLDVDPTRTLLDVVRKDLGLTGTKQGCDYEGECGACTVLVNNHPVRSCLTPVGKIAGKQVTTIEGLGSPDHLHPLQQSFIETGAVQCGYCTPGMLLTAKALLDREDLPDREQIISEMAGNLCRCTGYNRIVEAVEKTALILQGETDQRDSPPLPGPLGRESTRRIDAEDKVTGRTKFVEDIKHPGTRYLQVLRSPHHYARLLALDVGPADEVPGVIRVLTASDIPGENGLGDYSSREPVLTPVGETCKHLGAPVALIVAADQKAAHQGAAAVQVQYQVLPHFFQVDDALAEDAPPLYPNGNILSRNNINHGDLELAFNRSDVIVNCTYQTAWQEHSALERETILGYYDNHSRLCLVGGNHEPHWHQGYIAASLDLDLEEVRVITPPTGGSFGGKQDPWPFIATALAVYHTGQPVLLAYSRKESFDASPKRHPYQVTHKLGATREGKLTGIQVRIDANTGGYDAHGQYLTDFALSGAGGPYHYQAVDAAARSIFTNGPKAGQFRGFGSPQSSFALECALDELAQALDQDPVKFRLANHLPQEANSFLGYPVGESLGYREVLEEIQPHYQSFVNQAAEFNQSQSADSQLRKGVGFSGMWYRFGKSGSLQVKAEMEIQPDGKLILYCSGPDYGQGSSTAMTRIAAQELGLPPGQIQIINADTAYTPDSGIQGASRTTYFVGGAVQKTARVMKHTLLTTAAELLDCSPEELNLSDNKIESPRNDQSLPLEEIARELDRLNISRRVSGELDLSPYFPAGRRPQYLPLYVTGAQTAEVLVDLKTGTVQVPKITAVHDVGHAINPIDARGQVEGAILMGLGTALMEEYLPGLTAGFGDYYLPTTMSAPEIETILIEVPSFHGPFGAKGLGEAAIVPTAPAIINGISRTIGRRIRTLPATPERVLSALKTGQDGG